VGGVGGGEAGKQGGSRGGEETPTYLSGARLVSPGRLATTETRTAMLGYVVACVRVCVWYVGVGEGTGRRSEQDFFC
jgi:hypothetical protein